jgi:hypothetical protein
MKKLYFRLAILTLPLLFLYQNCGIQAPGVDNSGSNGDIAGLVFDSTKDVILDEYTPTYSLSDISAVTQNPSAAVHMYMNHATTQETTTYLGQCINCHANANATPPDYTHGVFHATLAAASMSQPTSCGDCHNASGFPQGFVGPVQTLRSPNSPSMKHTAVVWNAGSGLGTASPTSTSIVTYDCSTCHVPPTTPPTSGDGWNVPNPIAGTGSAALFHASIAAAGLTQPSSCIDCHGNSQPWTTTSYFNGTTTDTVPQHNLLPQAGSTCTACHTFPGSGTASSPNWKSAGLGTPTTNVILLAPTNTMWASTASASIPHPVNLNGSAITSTSCTICHGNFGATNSINGWDHQAETFSCGFCHFPNNLAASSTAFTFSGDAGHPAVDAFTDCTTCHSVGNPVRPDFSLPTFSAGAFSGGAW